MITIRIDGNDKIDYDDINTNNDKNTNINDITTATNNDMYEYIDDDADKATAAIGSAVANDDDGNHCHQDHHHDHHDHHHDHHHQQQQQQQQHQQQQQ